MKLWNILMSEFYTYTAVDLISIDYEYIPLLTVWITKWFWGKPHNKYVACATFIAFATHIYCIRNKFCIYNTWTSHMQHMSHMQHLYFAYATYVAYATHVLRICNICRVCNTCISHMQYMLHMQHILTKSDFFQRVPDEIFFNSGILIPAPVNCTKLKRNLQ